MAKAATATALDNEAWLLSAAAEVFDELRSGQRISLRDYARQAWHVVEPATPYIHGWHIDAICDHLSAVTDGHILRLLINIPPRHMKSLLISVFWPTWAWTRKPDIRWLYSSYSLSLSKRDSLKCRRVIDSPWYQERWGDVYQLASDQNEKLRFENDHSGYRLATSVAGTNTGEGGDIVVIDDPHNAKQAESEAKREDALEWFDGTMSTRLNNPKTGAMVVVMQRVHERDVSGHILEQGGWEHLCLPAEYEPKPFVQMTSLGFKDPRTEPNELLWPDRFGRPELDKLKASLGGYRSAGQLQQRPAPADGGIFKRHWFKFWQYRGQNLSPVVVRKADGTLHECPVVTLPDSFDEQLQSWDLAFKDTNASAYVVGQVWGKVEANKYLLDQI
ncbi:MAG: terminase, partial [Acidobacteria bacterium]|nr:terminase [Acidobacteriota bacterium]